LRNSAPPNARPSPPNVNGGANGDFFYTKNRRIREESRRFQRIIRFFVFNCGLLMSFLDDLTAYADPALAIHVPEELPAGIPFAVKDNIDVAGMPTTAACPEFSYQPAADATVVARLRAHGFVPACKTNLDQFATGLVGTRSPYGVPRNCFDATRIPGGSSSGSACAVAAGLVPFALGTDTAGSGRVPAAFQGLIGLKPTKGWLSTRGVVPAVRSLDCVSVFARSVAQAWDVTRLASGFDDADPFSRIAPTVTLPMGSLRLGVPAASFLEVVTPGLLQAWKAAVDQLRGLGHSVVEIDYAPFLAAAEQLYGGAWVCERTAAVGDFLDSEPAGADPIVAAIIRSGRGRHDAVAAYRAHYELMQLRRQADEQWQRMDVLVLPTVVAHPTLGQVRGDPVGVNGRLGLFTNFANLLDTCALAVPAGKAGTTGSSEGHLPAGITLFAPAWHDGVLARLAASWRGEAVAAVDDGGITVAVFGAHLRGQPLNQHLIGWGAAYVGECMTAAMYHLHRVSSPERPGLVRVTAGGRGFPGELWRMSAAAFGQLTASVTAPLAIGTVTLADGTLVKGFVCESAGAGEDISAWGGWRAFRAAAVPSETARGG
jgi:allophanate hydrolase